MRSIKFLALVTFTLLSSGAFAEYGGIFVKFEMTLKNGTQKIGHRFIAHYDSSSATKEKLENNPNILLQNHFTYELGSFGFYEKRLVYQPDKNYRKIYHLIGFDSLNMDLFQSLKVLDMIYGSYAVGISSKLELEDQKWMNTPAIGSFVEEEDLCYHQTYIHSASPISDSLKAELTQRLAQFKEKMESYFLESEQDNNAANDAKTALNKFEAWLKELMKRHPELKTITVTECTC